MNVSQLHERVRLELLRRMERGALTASLLARKTGLQQPHISNFVHSRRRLSITALDRVLAALRLGVEELVPAPAALAPPAFTIPLVSQEAAMHQEQVLAAAVQEYVQLNSDLLRQIRKARSLRGLKGDRFVAVALTDGQAQSMNPVLRADSIVVLDRHAGVPAARSPVSRSLYAVRLGGHMQFFHVSYEHSVLLLRPYAADQPAQVLRVDPPAQPGEFLVGRVCAQIAPC